MSSILAKMNSGCYGAVGSVAHQQTCSYLVARYGLEDMRPHLEEYNRTAPHGNRFYFSLLHP